MDNPVSKLGNCKNFFIKDKFFSEIMHAEEEKNEPENFQSSSSENESKEEVGLFEENIPPKIPINEFIYAKQPLTPVSSSSPKSIIQNSILNFKSIDLNDLDYSLKDSLFSIPMGILGALTLTFASILFLIMNLIIFPIFIVAVSIGGFFLSGSVINQVLNRIKLKNILGSELIFFTKIMVKIDEVPENALLKKNYFDKYLKLSNLREEKHSLIDIYFSTITDDLDYKSDQNNLDYFENKDIIRKELILKFLSDHEAIFKSAKCSKNLVIKEDKNGTEVFYVEIDGNLVSTKLSPRSATKYEINQEMRGNKLIFEFQKFLEKNKDSNFYEFLTRKRKISRSEFFAIDFVKLDFSALMLKLKMNLKNSKININITDKKILILQQIYLKKILSINNNEEFSRLKLRKKIISCLHFDGNILENQFKIDFERYVKAIEHPENKDMIDYKLKIKDKEYNLYNLLSVEKNNQEGDEICYSKNIRVNVHEGITDSQRKIIPLLHIQDYRNIVVISIMSEYDIQGKILPESKKWYYIYELLSENKVKFNFYYGLNRNQKLNIQKEMPDVEVEFIFDEIFLNKPFEELMKSKKMGIKSVNIIRLNTNIH